MTRQQTYQKIYKEQYKQDNKIISFPLSNIFYEELRKRSIYYDLKVNSYAKSIVTNFLNSDTPKSLSKEKVDFIKEYMQISRGIATNINQIAYRCNSGENINTDILLNSLKQYEDEFKKFISKA